MRGSELLHLVVDSDVETDSDSTSTTETDILESAEEVSRSAYIVISLLDMLRNEFLDSRNGYVHEINTKGKTFLNAVRLVKQLM